VAATSESGEIDTIAAALRLLGLQPGALEPAETAGLAAIAGSRLEFRHPLLRSAVYHGASEAQRRGVHRALATALSGERAADDRAWHLAAATIGPDEAVAGALAEAGARARARTGYPAALRAFARAAELSTDREARSRRLAAAAEAAQLCGRPERALELLDQAVADAPDRLLRCELDHHRGQILLWSGRPGDAYDLLVDQAAVHEKRHPAKAALMLIDAAFAACVVGHLPPAVATGRHAKALAERAGAHELGLLADTTLMNILVLSGDPSGAQTLRGRVQPFVDRIQVTSPAVHVLQTALNALMLMEEYEGASALVDRTVAEARATSALAVLPNLLLVRAWLEFLTGEWSAAYANASEGARLGDETHQPIAGAYALTAVAQIEAARGRGRECREHAAQALACAESSGADSIKLHAATALGLLELGLGRPGEAIARLESVERLAAAHGVREVGGPIQWRADLVEAYIRAGREQDARRVLERFERAAHSGRTSLLAAAARARGLLADDDAFEPEFERAHGWHDRTPTPFARAPTSASASGCGAPSAESRPARLCATRSRCSSASAPDRGPSARGPNCAPAARPHVGATPRPPGASPLRNCRWRSESPPAPPTGRRPPSYSSAPRPSSTTSPTSTASSTCTPERGSPASSPSASTRPSSRFPRSNEIQPQP
jgi:tetratricopeptide (TPR) repeat protein